MRRIFGTALAVALGTVRALAADDPMAGFYGNTVVVAGGGFEAHVHYRADHTLDMSGTNSGQAFSTSGTWKIDDNGQLCRSYDKTPPTLQNPLCSAATPHKVGDTWTITTLTGITRNISLVAGVH
jgi:hypothetical protein